MLSNQIHTSYMQPKNYFHKHKKKVISYSSHFYAWQFEELQKCCFAISENSIFLKIKGKERTSKLQKTLENLQTLSLVKTPISIQSWGGDEEDSKFWKIILHSNFLGGKQ